MKKKQSRRKDLSSIRKAFAESADVCMLTKIVGATQIQKLAVNIILMQKKTHARKKKDQI